MRFFIQWVTDPVSGWVEYDTRDVASLPRKPKPPADRLPIFLPGETYETGGRVQGFSGTQIVIDNTQGWVNRLCIQGVCFYADIIAIRHLEEVGYIEIINRWIDPVKCSVVHFSAAYSLNVPGGCFGPWQEKTLYTDDPPDHVVHSNVGPVIVKPMEFAPVIPASEERYGIYVTSDLFDESQDMADPQLAELDIVL